MLGLVSGWKKAHFQLWAMSKTFPAEQRRDWSWKPAKAEKSSCPLSFLISGWILLECGGPPAPGPSRLGETPGGFFSQSSALSTNGRDPHSLPPSLTPS